MPKTFKGGVHPNYNKFPDVPVTVIAPPDQVVIPLIQHIGAPNKPLVQVGDYVKMGQKIGENGDAPVSAPVHASVSGKVIAVEPRPHPLGDLSGGDCIFAYLKTAPAGFCTASQEKCNIG